MNRRTFLAESTMAVASIAAAGALRAPLDAETRRRALTLIRRRVRLSPYLACSSWSRRRNG